MNGVLQPFGYYSKLQFYGFMFDDVKDLWCAVCKYEDNFFEYGLSVLEVKVRGSNNIGFKLILNDTPYGDLNYYSLTRMTDITHQQNIPQRLFMDIMQLLSGEIEE